MDKTITCKTENGETVIRIPASLESRVLVAVEGVQNVFSSGWVVQSGAAKAEIPLELLIRLSAPISNDRIATIRQGEAIWPIDFGDCPEPSEKNPEQGPGRSPSGAGEA